MIGIVDLTQCLHVSVSTTNYTQNATNLCLHFRVTHLTRYLCCYKNAHKLLIFFVVNIRKHVLVTVLQTNQSQLDAYMR